MIPDGRISRVRFEATTSPRGAFLSLRQAEANGRHTPWERKFAHSLATVFGSGFLSRVTWTLRPCPSRCGPTGPSLGDARPSHVRYYGLMCQSCCLPPLGMAARDWVFAAWTTHGWSSGPSRRYLCESFPACLDPYPGRPCGASYPFLPTRQRPSPVRTRSALTTFRTATSVRSCISWLQSFLHVQARRFARHPGRSYRYGLAEGSRDFYVRAFRGLLPPHAPDMLTVRIGQLTV